MSNEAITWSMRVRVPSGNSTAKHVLFVLGNQANGDPARGVPMLSHPSIAYLVDATGQDRKTVIQNLQKLQEWGLISDTGRRCGRTGQVVIYELHTGPDLLTAIEIKESRNRNSSKIGTVPKSEQFQNRRETVPILDSNSPNIGTRNQEQPLGTSISPAGAREGEGSDADRAGTFEGHGNGPFVRTDVEPTESGRIAVELRKRGFRITSQSPALLDAVAEGVTLAEVIEFADLYPATDAKCRGSPGYVLSAARRQHAENVQRAEDRTDDHSRGPHATHNRRAGPESAVDRAARRARDIVDRTGIA